jgi:FtsP/CotA-like multicopper oxidase with cupredoxin domain
LKYRRLGAASVIAVLACGGGTAMAQTATASSSSGNAFHEPPAFNSQNGVLDILMNVKAKPIPTINFTPPHSRSSINPEGWAYEICKRTSSTQTTCPTGSGTVWDYGGVRLGLQQGDTLKIHFTNLLPKLDPNKLEHSGDPGDENIPLNPTNLHTHGLLTPARAASTQDPTWGDDVFVQVFNPANGMPQPTSQSAHQHGDIVVGPINYRIPVPNNHPSGLLWYHAHLHALALDQVSKGMAGLLTIGNVGDVVSGDVGHTKFPDANVRHMLLKEIQVAAASDPAKPGQTGVDFGHGFVAVANGEVLPQTDAAFCDALPAQGEVRHGSCPGVDASGDGDANFTGGVWYFTVNGIQYPTIPITKPDGEIWRIGSAAGSLSWDLQLLNDQSHKPMIVQLVAIDGVAVNLPQDTPTNSMVAMAGGKFHVVPCPAVQVITSVPVCVDEIVMMPSSRVDVWVTYRNSNGVITTPPAGATATFRNQALTMGSGDTWAQVDLAKVQFNQTGTRQFTANQLNVSNSGLLQPGGMMVTQVPNTGSVPVTTPADCTPTPLPAGHRRRIFFGFSLIPQQDTDPPAEEETFALGYEEVDQNGNVVPGSHRPIINPANGLADGNGLEQFDPTHTTICLPLNAGQMPVTETWELIQLATENHNFHLHQSRFIETVGPNQGTVIQDNFPLGVSVPDAAIADQVNNNQLGVCNVRQWRQGDCVSPAVVEKIPFTQVGEFVYHCHILEHEDGGMMARIVVVPSPN